MSKGINPERVKRAVYNRIDFELPERVWEEIDTAFAICWNEVIGYGNDVYKDTIMDYVVGHLKRQRILLSVDKVNHIVDIILDYIEMTGGFLDEDAAVIPVKPRRDKKGRILEEEEQNEVSDTLTERIHKRNEEGVKIVEKMLQQPLTEEELQKFIRHTQESQENLQRLIELGVETPEGETRRRKRMKKLLQPTLSREEWESPTEN